MVESKHFCEVCWDEFDTAEEAEACEIRCRNRLADLHPENPPTCPFCDMPAEFDGEPNCEGWEFNCECGPSYAGDEYVLEAFDGAYERTMRLQGVEVYPWEYPGMKFGG